MAQQKLNILFLSSWYPTRVKPTNGNFVEKHAEAAALYSNVNVLHVCFDSKMISKQEYVFEEHGKLKTHIFYLRKAKNQIPFFSFLNKSLRVLKAYRIGFTKIYADKQPDIIHANILVPCSLIAFYFKLFKHIPFIITEHWTGYLPQDPNKPNKLFFIFRCFAKKASCIAPVTQNLATAMRNYRIKGHYKIVPNVVDTDIFKEKVNRRDSDFHILHVSSLLDVQKNFSGILVSLQSIKNKRDDFVLEIISDGNFEQYQQKIERLGLAEHIIFHGKKSTSEVAAIMKYCDFLLLFSNYENFPCVIPEAWSCGLPVLSTNVGGISEYLNKKNGVLVNPHDIEELSNAIEKVFDSIQDYNSNTIRTYALNNFSYNVIGSEFTSIYNHVLK
ncbi:MAG: glycosyltransferase [Bacteroidota bacterium]